MKICMEINLYTDGDYYLNNYMRYASTHKEDDGDYHIEKVFELNKNDSDFDLKLNVNVVSYLEKILCDMNYSYTHYYIIEDIYNLFNNAIEFVMKLHDDSYEKYFYDNIGGNYDGTEITITVTE